MMRDGNTCRVAVTGLEDGEQSTHRFPDELITALATPADTSELGAAWAAIEAFLEAVRGSAVEAQHTGAHLYLWNSI